MTDSKNANPYIKKLLADIERYINLVPKLIFKKNNKYFLTL